MVGEARLARTSTNGLIWQEVDRRAYSNAPIQTFPPTKWYPSAHTRMDCENDLPTGSPSPTSRPVVRNRRAALIRSTLTSLRLCVHHPCHTRMRCVSSLVSQILSPQPLDRTGNGPPLQDHISYFLVVPFCCTPLSTFTSCGNHGSISQVARPIC